MFDPIFNPASYRSVRWWSTSPASNKNSTVRPVIS